MFNKLSVFRGQKKVPKLYDLYIIFMSIAEGDTFTRNNLMKDAQLGTKVSLKLFKET